jgi:hypothetical protein
MMTRLFRQMTQQNFLTHLKHPPFCINPTLVVWDRVARWYIFRPKIAIWVNFGGSCNERCWYIWSILRPLDKFCGHLVYFVIIWYIYPRLVSGNPGVGTFPNRMIRLWRPRFWTVFEIRRPPKQTMLH